MNKCDKCKLRQYMAITFDLHWMGEDDCPFGCPVEAPTVLAAEEVYGQYTDTAGNFYWTGTHSGEHTIKAEEGE